MQSEPVANLHHAGLEPISETATVAGYGSMSKQTTAELSPRTDIEHAAPKSEQHKEELKKFGIKDNMLYRTKELTTWEAFKIRHTTIWSSPELWAMMRNLALVSLLVAVLTVMLVPDPERMKIGKFTEVSKFLNVVVGLLLGFFLTSSMNRWYNCVNGFLELLDAIRNLQMQFEALGVPRDKTILTLRYGFASAWLLHGQLLIEAKRLSPDVDVSQERDALWHMMTTKKAKIDGSGKTFLLTQCEADKLRLTRDPPGMMWMWVAALLGRLAQDGYIPPMASPTYGRIMNLAQNAHGGIRTVRASISVQAPLTYTHMLATLVHINNLLNAITFGIVSGLACGTALMEAGYLHHIPGHSNKVASSKEAAQDWQQMVVTFLYCFFGPLLYQALLLISMHLAQPFDETDTAIPMDRLLNQLEVDMVNGRDLLEGELPFEKPCFKQPPPAK